MNRPDLALPTAGYMAAVGMFDGVHRGHRFVIRRLAEEAEARGLKPLAVTFSRHPLSVIAPDREPKLLTSPDEKRRLLLEAGAAGVVMLDFTPELRAMTAAGFMRMLRDEHSVAAMMVGYDHRFGSDSPRCPADYAGIGREEGVEVVVAPPMPCEGAQVSSSAVRRMLGEGDVEGAAGALGRLYSIDGTVVAGRQLGRTIGFPTANISVDPLRMIPATGVYAARVHTSDGTIHGAMVNVGHRPTVDNQGELSIEANIFGFDGNLYGSTIGLEFAARIRDERRFPDLEALKSAIAADSAAARQVLEKLP